LARKKRTEAQEARRFGWILPIVLGAIAGVSYWRGFTTAPKVLIGIGLAGLVASLAAPGLWLRFFRLWMKLAEAMGFVMTRVLLGAFFFIVLTPVGLVKRLFGKDSMETSFRDGKPTYWIDKAPVEATLERYEKQY
jgi:hypothetical protein